METNELEEFFMNLEEPNKSCLLYMRSFFKTYNSDFTEHYKWKLPNYSFKGKPFCYLWIDKKTKYPYIGFMRSKNINHPELDLGNRKSIKTFTINPNEDIPVDMLTEIVEEVLSQY